MKVKTMFGRKPKVIRSDRGEEYIGNRIIEMLKSEEIRMQYTAPCTPQKNDVTERKSRTLIKMARCMFLEAVIHFLGKSGEQLIIFRIIHLPGQLTKHRTNCGLEASSVRNILQFVELNVLFTYPQRSELDNVAEPIFLGYDEHSKAYRCYDPLRKKIVIGRDALYQQNVFSIKS